MAEELSAAEVESQFGGGSTVGGPSIPPPAPVQVQTPQEMSEQDVANYVAQRTPPQAMPSAPSPQTPESIPKEMTEEQVAGFVARNAPDYLGSVKGSLAPVQSLLGPESAVGRLTKFLAYPLRFETGAAMKGAEVLGIPGAKEWNDIHNTDRSWAPDAYVSDISDFYVDKASQAMGIPDTPGLMGDMARGAITGTKFGLGLVANVYLDPVMGLRVLQPTQEALEIQKMGGAIEKGKIVPKNIELGKAGVDSIIDEDALRLAGKQKNLFAYRLPFGGPEIPIKGQPVQDALSKITNLPPVKAMGSMLQALSPDIGDPVADKAGRINDILKRSDPQEIKKIYGDAVDALHLTPEEERMASALGEATPNLRPPLPAGHIKAAEMRPNPSSFGPARVRDPNFWGNELQIRSQMVEGVEKTAKSLGITLAPGRAEAVVEAALIQKRGAVEDLMNKFHAGALTEGNIATKTRPNYVPHVITDPSYEGVKNLAEYEAKLKADEAQVTKGGSGPFMSSKDPTRQRIREGTIESKNAKMLEAKGIPNYYVTNPVKAQMVNLVKSRKLLRDSQYLDVAKDLGTDLKRAGISKSEAAARGLVPVHHPELEGKTVVLHYQGEGTTTVRHGDLYYPKAIASKIQSRVAPPPVTGMIAGLRNFNRVFRSAVFLSSPGMRFGNSVDNMLKAMAQTGGDFMQSAKDAWQVSRGTSSGFRSAPTALRPNGVFYDGQTLRNLGEKLVPRGGAFAEGGENFLSYGKKMTFEDAMQRPGTLLPRYTLARAKDMIAHANEYGEWGEHFARRTLFYQRLRAGWEPEQAASDVVKWMFDYNRNSPITEAGRYIVPFLQHPIKTALIAPELLGSAPGTYNFVQNGFPHVLANAFHDPVTQAEINTVLPNHIKQRDGIAGPFIPAGSLMASIFGKPGAQVGSMFWFDKRIGLEILNHFDYFTQGSQEGINKLLGETSPVIQGLTAVAFARGDFGKSLDYANNHVNLANRLSYGLTKVLAGVSPFPNAEKMIMQAFDLVDPKHVEPYSVLIMKGLGGQFGGVTDLDHDIQSRIFAARHAFEDQKKQLGSVLRQEMGSNLTPGSLGRYVKNEYGSIKAVSPTDYYMQVSQSAQELQQVQLGAKALGGGMSLGDFVARMKMMADEVKRLNLAYQVLGARYLQMAQGSKSPEEAQERTGLKVQGKGP